MKKIKRFELKSSCQILLSDEMTDVVGGVQNSGECMSEMPKESCFGVCGYPGLESNCTYGLKNGAYGCYCAIKYY